jgi:hypothetical protein
VPFLRKEKGVRYLFFRKRNNGVLARAPFSVAVPDVPIGSRPTRKLAGANLAGNGLTRLRENAFGLSFRGAGGDEESRIGLKTLRARFLSVG